MASIKAQPDPTPKRLDVEDRAKVEQIWRAAEQATRDEVRRNLRRGLRARHGL